MIAIVKNYNRVCPNLGFYTVIAFLLVAIIKGAGVLFYTLSLPLKIKIRLLLYFVKIQIKNLIIRLRFYKEVTSEADDGEDSRDEEGREGEKVGQAFVEVDVHVTVQVEALPD